MVHDAVSLSVSPWFPSCDGSFRGISTSLFDTLLELFPAFSTMVQFHVDLMIVIRLLFDANGKWGETEPCVDVVKQSVRRLQRHHRSEDVDFEAQDFGAGDNANASCAGDDARVRSSHAIAVELCATEGRIETAKRKFLAAEDMRAEHFAAGDSPTPGRLPGTSNSKLGRMSRVWVASRPARMWRPGARLESCI
ncbi:hypothetical protein F442_01064 [Phytophthora nicotianae P10297]|uniref:Uncharacterized protein n=1 Tax=Phytophthora nicotianae P10297 TaxID=1317064 RepID=W3A3F1_PHYNI|nr:hypothetical protein F442_01064 [Phytophthora nicotianae P10297]